MLYCSQYCENGKGAIYKLKYIIIINRYGWTEMLNRGHFCVAINRNKWHTSAIVILKKTIALGIYLFGISSASRNKNRSSSRTSVVEYQC